MTEHWIRISIFLLVTLALVPLDAQVCGDCNRDGTVNILDALGAAQISAGIIIAPPGALAVCDVNSSGLIDIIDALLIAQFAAGLPATLTCVVNQPPMCAVTAPLTGPVAGDVGVGFDLVDPDTALLQITLEFSTDGGVTFALATLAPTSPAPLDTNPAPAVPPGPGQTMTWDTVTDIPSFATATIRLSADDGASLVTCSRSIDVDNRLAACTILFPSGGTYGADIPIVFDLTGMVATADLAFEYSSDAGMTWVAATVSTRSPAPVDANPALAVPVGQRYTFLWASLSDVGPLAINAVFRVVVGPIACSTTFDVDWFGAVPLPPQPGDLTIAELYADPEATLAGDANGDGIRDASQDEFVEIVNTSATPVDLAGVTIADAFGIRHTFPAMTILDAGHALVVFGGGTPTGPFGANQTFVASTGTLGLNNGGDTVTIASSAMVVIDAYTYGAEGGFDVALVANPEPTSSPPSPGGRPLVDHTTIPPGDLFSPGTHADGFTPRW